MSRLKKMSKTKQRPKCSRARIARCWRPDLEISRIVTGLWQVADMERGGETLDPVRGAAALAEYACAAFDTFDMADHYGSAEVITAGALQTSTGHPEFRSIHQVVPQARTDDHAGDRPRRRRTFARAHADAAPRSAAIPLVDVRRSARYIDGDVMLELERLREEGLIRNLGLTNFDTAHLRLLLNQGITIATNQVCMSLLDRRGNWKR